MERKFRRKGRRGSSRAHILLLLLLLTASIVLAKEVLTVKKVEVKGNSRYSEYDIISIAKPPYGEFIFNIDMDAMKSNFLGNGDVEWIGARVRFPNVLEVTIAERVPRALVNCLGVYALVNEDCVVIQQYPELPNYLLPVVNGVKHSRHKIGEAIISTEAGQIRTVSNVLAAIYKNGCQDQISELNVSNLDNLYLMERGGCMIVLGDDSRIEEKLTQMQRAMEKISESGQRTSKIDVSGTITIFSLS